MLTPFASRGKKTSTNKMSATMMRGPRILAMSILRAYLHTPAGECQKPVCNAGFPSAPHGHAGGVNFGEVNLSLRISTAPPAKEMAGRFRHFVL
jgi:hypothetical protein